jgi:hypothetical protein
VSKGMRRIHLLSSDLLHHEYLASKFPNISEAVIYNDSSASTKSVLDRIRPVHHPCEPQEVHQGVNVDTNLQTLYDSSKVEHNAILSCE